MKKTGLVIVLTMWVGAAIAMSDMNQSLTHYHSVKTKVAQKKVRVDQFDANAAQS